ncbi:GntR family transcriptional regulator [Streptomyces formicae]|uniref:GntR family transcriptional regulator n=1 Tax=Streptomyces formicae TaxID=1616117 RepID=A0ABY3WJG7_9ACTN|nr:GntR family transcriptional regulator [Streptomyces formicae]UNM12723.1 GntR family transcriptional regulator [Streptomyces formicae]
MDTSHAEGPQGTREAEGAQGALKRERVRARLLTLIETRHPGDAIPSERTLCAELDVSRPTLRAVVDELVATGRLVREHGRGMFVAPAKITQALVADDRPGAASPPAPGAWTSRVLELRTAPAGARIGRRLRVSPAAALVYVARLRLVDGAPIAIEHLHIPAELVPGLTPEQMESGFYAHLRDRLGIRMARATQSIEPTVLSADEAGLLDAPVLSPALLFDRVTTDAAGRPVEYVRSLYRGDRYRIVSRLTLSGRDDGEQPVPDASRASAWWGTVEGNH